MGEDDDKFGVKMRILVKNRIMIVFIMVAQIIIRMILEILCFAILAEVQHDIDNIFAICLCFFDLNRKQTTKKFEL